MLVGSAAAARAGALRPGLALVALATALALQVGANLVNDWADFRRGADGPDRLGPVRVTQAGLLAPRAVARGGILAFTVAATLGLVLIAAGGWPVALAGAAAIAAGVAYTAGPWPLAYHGLGEVFVFLFFGPVGVCGTELVQAGRVSPAALAASLPVGLMASAILVVNNVRDVDGDRRAASARSRCGSAAASGVPSTLRSWGRRSRPSARWRSVSPRPPCWWRSAPCRSRSPRCAPC